MHSDDTDDFNAALKLSVDHILQAANYLRCCGAICEDDEDGYYFIKANKLRDFADKLLPPDDAWPKVGAKIIPFVPRMRG